MFRAQFRVESHSMGAVPLRHPIAVVYEPSEHEHGGLIAN
jgi:hypothetical protein